MDLTLWRHQSHKTVISGLTIDQARRGYHQHVALLDHPIANYHRVTVNDPWQGDAILLDSETERPA